VKKIIYRRGSPVFVRNTLMNRLLFRHVLTDIIANSDQIKRNILQNNPKLTDDGKITIIYNGVDGLLPQEKDSGREPFVRTHGVVLGTAGRLSQEKGMDWLINMARELKTKKLDFILLIAGEGPLLEVLKQKSHEAGLDDHICFCGFVADMEKFYGSLDLFILTSAWEGCSNVILEAMHNGLPVVAFNNSSIPEMVRDNISGFLVRNKDGRALADKVELLIRDPMLRAQFGNAGKRIVREKYDQNAAFKQLMTLISR
jgi:glycosyltransferase involved in cell wall biosynthesis